MGLIRANLCVASSGFRAEAPYKPKKKSKKCLEPMIIIAACICCLAPPIFSSNQGAGFPSSFVSLGRKPVWISLDRAASRALFEETL